MRTYDDAFNFVVGAEGGFGADPHDRGNWTTGKIGHGVLKGTKYGISAMSYPNEDIANLTLDKAKAIYLRDYWQPTHCDEFDYPKAVVMFDCSVNQGVHRAIKFAQEAACVGVDGIIGPITIGAIQRMRNALFVDSFLEIREQHYRLLPTFGRYGNGWLNRLEHVKAEAMEDVV